MGADAREQRKMSPKSWFGFPVSPENLTPTAELVCICLTAVAMIFLLVLTVINKCIRSKTRGNKEEKTAERKSAKALSSGETENESKRCKVTEAEDQIDGQQEKQEVQNDVKEEVKTESVKLEEKTDTFCSGKNQSMENDLDNLKRELQAKEKELEKYEWLRNELIHGIKSVSQLKLGLATRRMQKLEDKVDELLHGQNPSADTDLQILQRKLEAKEKERTLLTAHDELIHGIKSVSQLKLSLATHRMQKLEDKVDELLHGQNQSADTDLQILQQKLEAKEKELKDKEAAVLKLNKDDNEKNLQTLKNNSPNSVANEETAEAEQEDAELTAQKQLESTNDVLESRVAELEQQLQDEQRRREEAEKDVKDLKVQVVTKERKLHQSSADRQTMSRTIDELKQTQTLLEERNAEIRKLRKECDHTLKPRNEENLKKKFETQNQKLEDKVREVQQQLKDEQQSRESLMEMNQELKRQLSELQERHKEELKKKIQLEQQWRKQVDEEADVLKQDLESTSNQLKTAKEEEPDASDEPSVPTEPDEALDTV